jgi:hypothetical protein
MSILDVLCDQLRQSPKNFFPQSSSTVLPPVGELPLLTLLNDSVTTTPTLPFSISAIEQLAKAVGIGDLKALDDQLLAFVKSGDRNALTTIFGNLGHLLDQAVLLMNHQLIIGASLLSIVNALNPANLDALFEGQREYFFGNPVDPTNPTKGFVQGYVTVGGEVIAPPTLPTLSSAADLKTFTKLLSHKTGDQYVRDLTRVGFEAVANNVWQLKQRYGQIASNSALKSGPLKINDVNKAQTWFKGFADYAEANVTSAVEQALSQSGGPVPSNALLAAGISTAAGTAARKATQHVFLEELGIGLR